MLALRRRFCYLFIVCSKEARMRIALMPGTANVVRFPVEQRAKPSLDLLYDIAPDSREVSLVAEAFGLEEAPLEIRHDADCEMAERIRICQWPETVPERNAALGELLKPLVERAVAACREAASAAVRSDDAAERFVNAQSRGGYWLLPLEDESTLRANEAARLLIEAHAASEAAFGAARAIRLAKAREAWRPFNLEEEANSLFFGSGDRRLGSVGEK